jgi:ZIP family zinc transporter
MSSIVLLICVLFTVILLAVAGMITFPVILSLLAGLSTCIGAIFVVYFPAIGHPQLAFTSGLTAAVMIVLSIFDMLIPAFYRDHIAAIGLFAMGFSLFFVIEAIYARFEPNLIAMLDIDLDKGLLVDSRIFKTAAMTMLTLTLHNLPEGLAVALSSLDSRNHGLVIAIAVAMHNIPEGLAIATPIYAATKNAKKALIWTACSGMSEPIGAIFAISVLGRGKISAQLLENILCIVGGIMCAVSLLELIPQGIRYKHPWDMCKGAIIGTFLMILDFVIIK